MKLLGLVAAAGKSERMGRPKALLPLDDELFVTRLARVLLGASASPVVVTVPEPPDDIPVRNALTDIDVVVTRNLAPADGLAGSIATALADSLHVSSDVDALVLCPVDMPFVTRALVHELVAAVSEGALAAVPVVDGARGHPLVVARALFGELADCAQGGGARAVLDRHEGELALLPWADARVVCNINTPADYERVMQRR